MQHNTSNPFSGLRYYKGEDESPYKDDRNKSMLWFYEKCYVKEMERVGGNEELTAQSTLWEYLSDYSGYGLLDFCHTDDTPILYKALLFNRYMKDEYSPQEALDNFKAFYQKYYGPCLLQGRS